MSMSFCCEQFSMGSYLDDGDIRIQEYSAIVAEVETRPYFWRSIPLEHSRQHLLRKTGLDKRRELANYPCNRNRLVISSVVLTTVVCACYECKNAVAGTIVSSCQRAPYPLLLVENKR